MLISQPGLPNPYFTYADWPFEFSPGDNYAGFAPQTPMFIGLADAFAKFKLWHSTIGINRIGIQHTILKREGGNSFWSIRPIFCGDMVGHYYVAKSGIEYLPDLGRYRCSLILGQNPPEMMIPMATKSFQYLDLMAEVRDEIFNEVMNAVEQYITTGMPLITAAGNGAPITVAPSLPIWQQLKAAAQAKIQAKKSDEEAKKWKI